MVQLVNSGNSLRHKGLLDRMFEDRKAVFVDLLKWDVPHNGRFEADQFDDGDAEYLIVNDRDSGEHFASLRLLRTDRPHVLGTFFRELCEGGVPSGPDIREISRMCLSPRHRGPDRVAARNLLASAMTEYALLTGIRGYTGVADMGWMSRVLSAGWRCEPLGLPRRIGGSLIGALMIHIDHDTIRRLQASGRYLEGVLRAETFERSLAA
ncbi:MAG TPA: acyl-homoserine-lactone synthase [Allosphingosinicella sp.]|jgi:acyl-homoserine lactone synthase|nr:acyl-homoserine-lactone synthase [Allosphingosinicella sp.]